MITNERLTAIYNKTDGNCHLCDKKLAFSNYGKNGAKGSWHIEHSKPRVNGGTDHLNNLYAACISCNCSKGATYTRTIRRANGLSRAPLSKAKKERIKNNNMVGYGAMGMLIGSGLGGPLGGFFGGIIGSIIGKDVSPKR